jgi:hypothetical protein
LGRLFGAGVVRRSDALLAGVPDEIPGTSKSADDGRDELVMKSDGFTSRALRRAADGELASIGCPGGIASSGWLSAGP